MLKYFANLYESFQTTNFLNLYLLVETLTFSRNINFAKKPMSNLYTGNIEGLVVIQPRVFQDDRGYFFESYQKETYESLGVLADFVQDNESKSTKGVLRGLHMQTGDFAQAKLVKVVHGSVWDVAVDVRADSPTYGQWFGLELSAENKLQFFIPRGFAHGFLVTSDEAIFQYKCDNYYNKESEAGIYYNSSSLAIDWPSIDTEILLSAKDKEYPNFRDLT